MTSIYFTGLLSRAYRHRVLLACCLLYSMTSTSLPGQIVFLETTPQADLIRAKADAELMKKQAELVGKIADAQQLDNMLKECDLAYKKMVSDQKTKGTLETQYARAAP
jgi:hypothetical protein